MEGLNISISRLCGSGFLRMRLRDTWNSGLTDKVPVIPTYPLKMVESGNTIPLIWKRCYKEAGIFAVTAG